MGNDVPLIYIGDKWLRQIAFPCIYLPRTGNENINNPSVRASNHFDKPFNSFHLHDSVDSTNDGDDGDDDVRLIRPMYSKQNYWRKFTPISLSLACQNFLSQKINVLNE